MGLFEHVPHPHAAARRAAGPVTVAGQRLAAGSAFGRFNARLGLKITTIVGTMACAYVFFVLAAYGLPAALRAGPAGLVLWTSSEFLQLCLLPVIIVGQNAQARASDKRAEQTYLDAEAILHECLQLQAHLHAQDDLIAADTALTRQVADLVTELRAKPRKPPVRAAGGERMASARERAADTAREDKERT
jgi:hypothetical protein